MRGYRRKVSVYEDAMPQEIKNETAISSIENNIANSLKFCEDTTSIIKDRISEIENRIDKIEEGQKQKHRHISVKVPI